MNSLQFEKTQLKYLASLLKCRPDEILEVIEHVNHSYSEYQVYKIDKSTGLPKTYRDGTLKKREVAPPSPTLKKLQRSIKRNILDLFDFGTHVHGAVKGKSNITNAKNHQGKKFIFTTDLQDFFPSVTNKMVYGVFLKLGYTHHLSRWLTKLTTLKYGLPQGAPTSAHLANFAFQETDENLLAFCRSRSITYTRFIDDLTFSSFIDFRHEVRDIVDILRLSGFKLSYRKTHYKGNQVITGIAVFNNYIDAPEHIKEKAKLEKNDPSNQKPFTNYLGRIRNTNRKN